MPIHEFRCSNCGEVGEYLVGIGRNSDDLVCKSCGADKLERLMSAPAVSVNNQPSSRESGSTCCGPNPSREGCVPGSCCGSTR
ncbi:MAG: hypothetical protein LDL33_13615 [Desulfomonile sp.]|nr:hypothetical protein [Desulfomonile sp.]